MRAFGMPSTTLPVCIMQHDPQAHLTYTALRQRGCSHGRAVRGVADRMLDLICTLLRHDSLYDPQRRTPKTRAA